MIFQKRDFLFLLWKEFTEEELSTKAPLNNAFRSYFNLELASQTLTFKNAHDTNASIHINYQVTITTSIT